MGIQKVIRRLISLTEHLERMPGSNEAIAKDIAALEEATEILIEKEQRPVFKNINDALVNILRIAAEKSVTTNNHIMVSYSGHIQSIHVFYYPGGYEKGKQPKYYDAISLSPSELRSEGEIIERLQIIFDELWHL